MLPHTVGICRLDFHAADTSARGKVYIGETSDLARRACNHRNAANDSSRQRTSRRIHQLLVAHLEQRGRIDLAIGVDVSLGIDTVPVDLRRKSARLLAENAAVLLAQLDGDLQVLNIDADLSDPDQAEG